MTFAQVQTRSCRKRAHLKKRALVFKKLSSSCCVGISGARAFSNFLFKKLFCTFFCLVLFCTFSTEESQFYAQRIFCLLFVSSPDFSPFLTDRNFVHRKLLAISGDLVHRKSCLQTNFLFAWSRISKTSASFLVSLFCQSLEDSVLGARSIHFLGCPLPRSVALLSTDR